MEGTGKEKIMAKGTIDLYTEPFAHAKWDNFLENEDLENLYRHLPAKEHFNWQEESLGIFQLWNANERKVGLEIDSFWKYLEERYFNEALKQELYELFRPEIEKRDLEMLGRKMTHELVPWKNSGSIDWRLSGNILPDHLDWPNRLLSVVLYLDPFKEAKSSWGTRLYEYPEVKAGLKEEFSRESQIAIGHLDETKYKQLDFKENRLVVFLNSARSFHGARVERADGSKGRLCIVKGINMSLEHTERVMSLPGELGG